PAWTDPLRTGPQAVEPGMPSWLPAVLGVLLVAGLALAVMATRRMRAMRWWVLVLVLVAAALQAGVQYHLAALCWMVAMVLAWRHAAAAGLCPCGGRGAVRAAALPWHRAPAGDRPDDRLAQHLAHAAGGPVFLGSGAAHRDWRGRWPRAAGPGAAHPRSVVVSGADCLGPAGGGRPQCL